MEYDRIKEKLISNIQSFKDEAIALNNDLADHPEISGQEYESSRKAADLLQKHGYNVEQPFAGMQTAFKAVYGEDSHRHKVAIIAEYDALPQIGHACGHCLSCAISLLAGLATREFQDQLDTDIHIIGTPDEEEGAMKCIMVSDGVFDDYDMAIMVHLYNYNLLAPKTQACLGHVYEFKGHALDAVRFMCHAIDMMRQHNKPDAQIHGIVYDGGVSPDIVPEKTTAEFYIRAANRKNLMEVTKKVDACAEGAAIATNSTWKKEPDPDPCLCDAFNINKPGTEILKEIYKELGLPLNGDPNSIFGTSDIGNVSNVCPSFHPCLQVVDASTAIHSKGFAAAMKTERAYDALVTGAEIIGLQIIKIFSDEEKVIAMKNDFKGGYKEHE